MQYTKKMLGQIFGDNLRRMRLKKGFYKVIDFSEASGIDKAMVTRYELGKTLPRLDKLVAICNALDVTVEELFYSDETKLLYKILKDKNSAQHPHFNFDITLKDVDLDRDASPVS